MSFSPAVTKVGTVIPFSISSVMSGSRIIILILSLRSKWLHSLKNFIGKYFKVLVGKGVLTYKDILDIIADNLR